MNRENEDMWNAVIASFIGRENRLAALTIGESMGDLRQVDPDGHALLTEHILWEEDDNG